MKCVREHINEKFVEDSDPIKDMGIGIYAKRNFDSLEKLYDFLYIALPGILKINNIKKLLDLKNSETFGSYINGDCWAGITKYSCEYLYIDGRPLSDIGASKFRDYIIKRLRSEKRFYND